jgi:hypothetical protein
MVEGDWFLTLGHQPIVDDIEHFQERHIWEDVVGLVFNKAPGIGGVLLAPNFKC